ncbi:MAG: hypothetical protein ABIG71_00315 [Candidatus Uhrbacteria bacterium]
MRLHALKLGIAGAIAAALCMIALSILNALGLYEGAVQQMQGMHTFYTPDVIGTITGMIEAALVTFIGLYVFGAIYNALLRK